jgi:hypothetical protein
MMIRLPPMMMGLNCIQSVFYGRGVHISKAADIHPDLVLRAE